MINQEKVEFFMETGKDGTEQLIIDRVRYFRRFETPSLIKCIDEITFYNTGEELSSVKYIFESFRASLRIFDSNGEQLEFYGYSDNEDKESPKIAIDFPKARPLSCGDHRTIRLEFVQEAPPLKLFKQIYFTVPLHETASLHFFLELPENYVFSILHYGVLDKNNATVEDAKLAIDKGDSFLNVSSIAAANDTGNLYIIFEHKIRVTLSGWYTMGKVFGTISVISIPLLYHFNPSGMVGIATAASFVISYMFIIKGWLFTKNMDKALTDLDSKYRFLIWLIFLEITFMALHYSLIFTRNE